MSRSMTCVILVAGHNNFLEEQIKNSECEELQSLQGIPKALLQVKGRNGKDGTILDLWWDELKERRTFSNVYLVTNADKYKYYERWATASDFPVENIINDGSTTYDGRIGAVSDFQLAIQTKDITGDVMVVSGDMLTNEDFEINGVKRFFDQHQNGDLLIYYDLKKGESPTTRGMVSIDTSTKNVKEFKEKPSTWDTPHASVVFYVFCSKTCSELIPEYLATFKTTKERSFGKLMEWLVPKGHVYGMKVPTEFKLIGATKLQEYLDVRKNAVTPTPTGDNRTFTTRAYARVGVVGNPSDGFNGKTIAMSIENFWAEVSIVGSEKLRLVPHPINDPNEFGGLSDLFIISKKEGYVGGLRLMQATCKKFYEYCTKNGIALSKRNFTMKYDTNIPRQVGLAGSSCIVTACVKALMQFYGITEADIPKHKIPSLVLTVEEEELFITAGLQDRVVQVYEGLVYMDFSKDIMVKHGHGNYERLDNVKLPQFFLMYASDPSDSGRIHSDVKEKWLSGNEAIVEGMRKFADLTDQGRVAFEEGDFEKVGEIMDANFNLRRELYGDACLGTKNLAMIELGRSYGGHMKFPGSGGAVLGLLSNQSNFPELIMKAQQQGFVCVPLTPHF
eukprot:TRINITY_DN902_c0_g1_i1.p1 TRINITY_DN902_c0_g1~~TRINITY_DN902_c0_g1_i1.p1  ORF type:complete len:640 (+),score=132.66 TRINITY_DN902_c0_g1_i1:67-1920(+)